MIREVLAVGLGGAVGSILRFMLSTVMLAGYTFFGFPLGTFTVNALGSLIIGILMAVLEDKTYTLIGIVGFCGGFTTFSTFSADTIKLLRVGDWSSASLYIIMSIVVCLICTALGIWIGTTITKLTA